MMEAEGGDAGVVNARSLDLRGPRNRFQFFQIPGALSQKLKVG